MNGNANPNKESGADSSREVGTNGITNRERPARRQWREDYIQIMKLRVRRCLEPTERCQKDAVLAHSIQNATVLGEISQDGHVIVLGLRHRTNGLPSVVWERVGRNKASTFSGLCSEHDNSIFRPIDQSSPDLSNPGHLFLLAYRSVLRETHACLEAAIRSQMLYQKRIEQGRSPRDQPDDAGMSATATISNAYDCHLYKRKFDEAFLEREYDMILHETLCFDSAPPSIAVSSVFSLDDMPLPDDVARVVLNVFPMHGKTHIIFSFLKNDADITAQYLGRIRSATGLYQKYLISKLILQHCDNFVMAPPYYQALSDTRRGRIREFFASTILQNRHDYEDENLYLF